MGVDQDLTVNMVWEDGKKSVQAEHYNRHVHPHGTVPALQLPGQTAVILESGAICLYLADTYRQLLPSDEEKANYYNWILYACSSLDQWMETLYHLWSKTEANASDPEVIDTNVKNMGVAMAYLDAYLKDRQFLCGDRLTAADCVLGYNIWWAKEIQDGQLIQGLTNIQTYLTRLMDRPAFQETFQTS